MKLWHCVETRSLRPLWLLSELCVDYELEVLPFPPRVHAREFLSVNRLGTVPYFQDGEVSMTESVAICQYLVEKYQRIDLGLRWDEPDYGSYLNWLHHADATLTFPLAVVIRYRVLERGRCSAAADDYEAFFHGRLRRLTAVLQDREYLCANRFTIADIAVCYALYLAQLVGLRRCFSPEVVRYVDQLTARPAFQRAISLRGERSRQGIDLSEVSETARAGEERSHGD